MERTLVIGAIVFVVLIVVLFIFGFYWLNTLRVAHSSFDNYYKFRGCVELINKTGDYGYCRIASGGTIKIVKYENRWFLDGDLPGGFPDW